MPLKKFRLISEEIWTQLRSQVMNNNNNNNNNNNEPNLSCQSEEQTHRDNANTAFSAELYSIVDTPTVASPNLDKYSELISQLPKCCRRKSNTIVSYLTDLNLDSNLRVLYQNGELGGHLAGESHFLSQSIIYTTPVVSDLLQWTTSSKMISSRMERPSDSENWLSMLKRYNIPPSCYRGILSVPEQRSGDETRKKSEKKISKIDKKNSKKSAIKWMIRIPNY